jgi:DHA3 family tetracycline resistance protein-like MFS transporter
VLSLLLARRQRNNPYPVYLGLMAGQAVCFALFFTVQLIYQVTVIGLTPFQMVLVGAVLETTCFLFEVPTGVVADVYSRRLSILIGCALIGGAYTLEGAVPAFCSALGGQLFWGVGYTFTSGAIQAWIADEIGNETIGPVFLRGKQMWTIGGLVGIMLAATLGLIAIRLPLLLAGAGMLALAGGLALVMPETRMRPVPAAERSSFGHMKATAIEGYRLAMARPVVKVLITISLVAGLAAEAFDRLNVPLVIDRYDFPTLFGSDSPVLWFGVSGVVGSVIGLAVSEVFKRRNPDALGPGAPARLLAGCAALQVVALVVFTLSGSLWLAFAMLWTRTAVSAISSPVEDAWLNRHLDASTRATVGSMSGQANSIGQVGGGLALGWVGSAVSIKAALLCSAVVLAPTVALYRRLIERAPEAAEPALTPAD